MNTDCIPEKHSRDGLASRRLAAMLLIASVLAVHESYLVAAPPAKLKRPEQTWRGPNRPTEHGKFVDWADKFLSAKSPGAKASLEAQGKALARERRGTIAGLIRNDPQRALELAVPAMVRKKLPKQIVEELEEPVSGTGELALFAALPEPGQEANVKPNFRTATINGQTFEAFVYGRRLDQPTRKNIPLHGVALDGAIAIDSNPTRVLDASEVEAAKQGGEAFCGTSGLVSTAQNDETALEAEDRVYFFCTSAHAEEFNENLIEQEEAAPLGDVSASGDPEASAWTEGQKKLIVIRVNFPDITSEPLTYATATNMVNGLDNFYLEMSYGRAGFARLGQGSEVTPTFTMAQPAAYYGTNNYYNQLRTEARNAATAAGYVLSNYNLDIICMGSVPGFNWAGLAYVGSAGAWLRNSFGTGVAGHELGHNFGLNHANYWDTSGASIIGPGTSVEYGDSFDTMGSASAGNNHFNARYKNYLNWLTASEVQTATASGLYRVYAHDSTNFAAGVRGLRVVLNSSTNYWVEFRQKFTSNKWLMSGAGLRRAGNSNQKSDLLDTTPGSQDAKTDSALVIGRTFSDKTAGIHITPVGKGGTTPESLDVVVNLGTFPGNSVPVVTVTASATDVATSATVQFTAAASDPNGDTLAYYWDFGDGNFGTNGPAAAKSWSTAGEYVVRCTVTDMKGGTASDSVIVRVGSPTTFRISGQVMAQSGPLEGVRVFVSSTRMTYTDSDGTYNLVGLGGGSYTANASLFGYTLTNDNFANPVVVGPSATNINFIAATTSYNAPAIVTQPQSQTVNLGANAIFSVAASGSTPMSYQWRFNGVNIAGATASSYTRANCQAADAGNYSVVVTNSYGTATSANAALTVNTPPVISSHPRDTTVVAGGTAQFSVSATGAQPMYYQWRRNGINIAGATSSAYTLANAQTAHAGVYSCLASNSLGTVVSSNAFLTVNVTLNTTATPGGSVAKSPDQSSYASGSIVTLTASSVSAYQFSGWSGDATGVVNPLVVVLNTNLFITANFTSPVPDLIVDNPQATLTGSWTPATSATDKYATNYVTASSAAGSTSATATFRPNITFPASYDIYVWHPTTSKPATVPVTIAYDGGTVSTTVDQSVNVGQWVLVAANRPFAAGTNGYVQLANNVGQGGKNIVADAVKWAYSSSQVLTAPQIVTSPSSQAVAAGSDVVFNVVATGTAPLNYQWRRNGQPIASATSDQIVLPNVHSTNAGSYDVLVSNIVGNTNSAAAALTVNNPPILTAIANRAIHAGITLTLPVQAIDPDNGQSLAFTLGPGALAAAYIDTTSGVLTWPTTAADAGTSGTFTVRVTDSGTPTLSDETSFQVNVDAPPMLQSIICTNSVVFLTWSAIPGASYRVQYKDNFTGSWNSLQPDVLATSTTASKSDALGISSRLYRIVVLP